MNARTGYLGFLGAAILYGTFGLFIRALQTDFDVLQQIALRSFGAALIAVPLAFAAHSKIDRKNLADPRLFLFTMLLPISIALWTWATVIGTVRSSIFGLYLGSLIASMILGRVFFRERLSRARVAGIMLSLAGLTVFCLPFDGDVTDTASLSLGAAAGVFQAASLCLRRWLSDLNRSLLIAAQTVVPLLLTSLLCALFDPISVSALSVQQIAISVSYGGLVVAVSYLVLIGSQNLDISKGSIILSTELAWAIAIAAVVLGEIPTVYEVLGSALLLASAVFVTRKSNQTS